MKKKPEELYSVNRLAEKLGIDRRTLKNYLKGTDPAGEENGNPVYRLEDAMLAVKVQLKAKSNRSAGKDRLTDLQCEKLETQLAILRREYVPAEEVEKLGAELGSAIRKIIVQLHLCAPQVVGLSVAEAESRLKDVEADILQQLHTVESANRLPCPHCNRDIFEKEAE